MTVATTPLNIKFIVSRGSCPDADLATGENKLVGAGHQAIRWQDKLPGHGIAGHIHVLGMIVRHQRELGRVHAIKRISVYGKVSHPRTDSIGYADQPLPRQHLVICPYCYSQVAFPVRSMG